MNGCSNAFGDLMHSVRFYALSFFVFMLAFLVGNDAQAQIQCNRTITADVVALDMPLMFNRLGAQNVNGMMYALKRDVVVNQPLKADGTPNPDHLKPITTPGVSYSAGNVTLRPDKRPRPLVLRTGRHDCLEITLTNLLSPQANPVSQGAMPTQRSNVDFRVHNDNQVAARNVTLRFQGTEVVNSVNDDGTMVGNNAGNLATPGGDPVTYTVYTPENGAFLGVSYGGKIGGEGLGGTDASGLWAVLNVNAEWSAFYRSQLTREELELASNGTTTPAGQPAINYEETYPTGSGPWDAEGKGGLPIVNMIQKDGDKYKTVHTAIDAIVAYGPELKMAAPMSGPFAGKLGYFPESIYPLEYVGKKNPTVPNRLEPFREFVVAFHDEVQTTQVFPKWYNDPVFGHTLHGVRDSFMINYGSGGIGSEIISNRLGVGPMHDCVNCLYEEFFLTSTAVGEVGQVTDIPANFNLENCDPALNNCGAVGPKANYVLYPEDPSNIHHSYIGDSTAFRNLHAGPAEAHVFHLHNHQWLFNANDDNSNYLDAQGLGPGAGYAYWINFGGAGNRNRTAGDAIFHCHFYPHFAQGMWEMWRIHDAFESGTKLQVNSAGIGTRKSFVEDGIGIGDGTPRIGDADNRALPDGEIIAGAPTPAVVPLPGRAIAPMPNVNVGVVANHNKVDACVVDGTTDQFAVPNANGLCPTGSTMTVNARPTGSLSKIGGGPLARGHENPLPGYPFWIAGMEHTVGNRPPTPPLDMIDSKKASALVALADPENPNYDPLWSNPSWTNEDVTDGWDGGLPRVSIEGYAAGGQTAIAVTRLDMSKEVLAAKPVYFPEEGTDLEQAAMRFHATRCHDTAVLTLTGYQALDCPEGLDTIAVARNIPVTGTQGSPTPDEPGFQTNGAPPIAGAPFQEPCIDDQGDVLAAGETGNFWSGNLTASWDSSGMMTTGKSPFNATTPRVYKAANVQFDAVLNKLGYHFPQQRIIALWQDVVPTINQERPPEPFIMRMNTFDCTQFIHSNVVPKAYELDDYQVRTPTDIIGQHIHLPKWDLTSADGSANGWNYEDGTLSPQAVVEIIHAINNWEAVNGRVTTDYAGGPVYNSAGENIAELPKLHALRHPFFGQNERGDDCTYGAEEEWCGARSTIQRWFSDPVVNVNGVDRGLGIIFTHDHYGPSTHQQVGLYATVLVQPAGSKWYHNETGEELYTRTTGPTHLRDGGPTSWQAAIMTGEDSRYVESVKATQIEPFREFYFEYTDFQSAYQPGVYVGIGPDGKKISEHDIHAPWSDANLPAVIGATSIRETFRDAIQPSIRKQASLKGGVLADGSDGFPLDIWEFPAYCIDPEAAADLGIAAVQRPCPEAISADDPGMYVVNYRAESLLARIYDPNKPGPDANGNNCSDPMNRTGCGAQADGMAGDLAFAMDSNTRRAIDALNTVEGLAPAGYFDNAMCDNGVGGTVFCPPINNPSALSGGDPFTPMMRVMDGDNVKVKMQAGGQEEEHTATLYGLKWLQGGSGFGESRNSGWRNAQAAGISEQFTLRMPVYADYGQRGNIADYPYTFNPSFDGWSSGSWGIMRSYKGSAKGDLHQLPSNAVADSSFSVSNSKEWDGVCPKSAPTRSYDITAVSANDVLRSAAGITIQDLYRGAHVGASPDDGGGSLVYNDRITPVAGVTGGEGNVRGGMGPIHDPTGMLYVNTSDLLAVTGDGYVVHEIVTPNKKGKGVTNTYEKRGFNPTSGEFESIAMTATDWDDVASACYTDDGSTFKYHPFVSGCDVKLRHDAPVEPVVIRAAAGECLDVTLRNKVLKPGTVADVNGDQTRIYRDGALNAPAFYYVPGQAIYADLNADGLIGTDEAVDGADPSVNWDQTLELATGNALAAIVRRDPGQGVQGMTSFNNNLIQPSAWVGMYPQLLELDVTRSLGMNVGQNPGQVVPPGGQQTYKWYAGVVDIDTSYGRRGNAEGTLTATPIEFGGFSIAPTDQIKQGQKGLYGAGAVYPAGSSWTVDASGTTSATVTDGAKTFRDFMNIAAKGASIFYADSYPVENIVGEGSFAVAEDAQDMGGMAINYGNEAMWLRFGRNPAVANGNAQCNGLGAEVCLGGVGSAEAQQAYANSLVGDDPQTAVFEVEAGQEYRMHVLMPQGPGRGSTFDLHGAVWQRDPYVCKGDADFYIPGKCATGDGLPGQGSVGSQSLGINPIGMYLGGIESWFPGQHYEIFIPSAGGTNAVPGDYLFRDHMGLGNTGGLWGILRVLPPQQ